MKKMDDNNMMMNFIKIILCCILLITIGCAKPQQPPYTVLSSFNRIDNKTPYFIQIHSAQLESGIKIDGDLNRANKLSMTVENNTLYLRHPRPQTPNGDITLTIYVPELNELVHDGSGYLQMTTGKSIRLQALKHRGSGSLNLYWVDSQKLNITASGSGQLLLAGIVEQLNVKVGGNVELDSRFLIARNGYIEANQNATARINVKNKLTTFANGTSNIYLYQNPKFDARYNIPSGSIIRVTGIPSEIF